MDVRDSGVVFAFSGDNSQQKVIKDYTPPLFNVTCCSCTASTLFPT